MKYIRRIDDIIHNQSRSNYRGNKDHEEWVIAKPEEAIGLLKWRIRIIKALAVLMGKADAFTYDIYQ